jgi:predicted RND superfamily exporter protein
MLSLLSKYYYNLVLRQPAITLLFITLMIAFFGYHTASFRLDASADSLVLEQDEALDYYRSIRARYGSDDYLIITYTPNDELFSDAVLQDLRSLCDKLKAMERVESVISMLDVPLINSPPVTIDDLQHEVLTLESPKTDRAMAREEFLSSPLYRNLIISPNGKTTAIQVSFRRDETWHRLLSQRDQLREKRLNTKLSSTEQKQLASVSQEFDQYSTKLQEQQTRDIAEVRAIMAQHRDKAGLFLGGVPMIASDSIDFIRHDLATFGIGVLCFMIVILTLVFRKPRWVILPMLTCFAAGVITVGFLGLVDWPVTVVSSNFISLLLIITLSLMIHLIVRYRELHEQSPEATQQDLVWETVRAKAIPCFYTAITTIVAFGSLLFSGIRPVIDFGWMMSIGVAVAFFLVFTMFPATLMFLKPGPPPNRNTLTNQITHFFARLNKTYSKSILMVFSILTIVSIVGISSLTVENRFIDYFKDSTEIYRGMELIDRELGGTIPLDVIVEAPPEFFAQENEDWEDFDDEDFPPPPMEQEAGITVTSYWFNTYQLQQVSELHKYLHSLKETGKVLSVATTMEILSHFDKDVVSDDFLLALFYKKLPEGVKQTLLTPYMAADGNQIRFSIRVFETEPTLQRDALLKKIRQDLTSTMNLKEEQVHLSGMLVLYNNMLQSLYRSQILTIGVVFLAIMFMFVILFRSLKMAFIAIIPNLFAPALMLGLMGWLKIPLDMMTITIAAISIGIAVDDTIHYIHRITREYSKDHDYWAAVGRSHATIGHAMYYTTVTITLGFSILALSNFIPTIYFGLLTGFAMLTALLAALTLLPLLIVRLKPLG